MNLTCYIYMKYSRPKSFSAVKCGAGKSLSDKIKRGTVKMSEKKCCCGCCGNMENQADEKNVMSLAELPVGTTATIVKVIPETRGRKKFADVGLVPGTELVIESHAPFGGLIRVKVMETSMALHKGDAANIMMKKEY